MISRIATLLCSSSLFVTHSQALDFHSIDFSALANGELATSGLLNGNTYPTGNQNLGGVPFQIPSGANNYWNASVAGGGNPRLLEVPVSLFGVTQVHTLINTSWGTTDSGVASVEFLGSDGAFFAVDLIGGDDIRDYNQNPAFPSTINGITTVEVFSNGVGQRLDKQVFDLPADFLDETLELIRFSDNGADGYSRIFVAGITAATDNATDVPDAGSSLALLGVALSVLLARTGERTFSQGLKR
jgi:hypothetical protein